MKLYTSKQKCIKNNLKISFKISPQSSLSKTCEVSSNFLEFDQNQYQIINLDKIIQLYQHNVVKTNQTPQINNIFEKTVLQEMNKSSKHKTSHHTIKSSRNLTIKQHEILTARSPQSNPKKLEIKKNGNMQKFKSIPTIPCRDMEMSSMPTENLIYQSYTGNNNVENVVTLHQSEPRLLYSISDRNNHSSSKMSLHSKVRGSSKKTTVASKNRSNMTPQTYRKNETLESLYQRTKLVLNSYRQKQQEWKKQKCYLLRQLQKYRPKNNKKRKNSSIISYTKKTKP